MGKDEPTFHVCERTERKFEALTDLMETSPHDGHWLQVAQISGHIFEKL